MGPDFSRVDSAGRRYTYLNSWCLMSRGRAGIPLVSKRVFYIELMKTGIGNSEACRRVGVNRKTGDHCGRGACRGDVSKYRKAFAGPCGVDDLS